MAVWWYELTYVPSIVLWSKQSYERGAPAPASPGVAFLWNPLQMPQTNNIYFLLVQTPLIGSNYIFLLTQHLPLPHNSQLKISAYRAATYYLLHAFCPFNIKPALAISYPKSNLPGIQIVIVISFSKWMRRASYCRHYYSVSFLLSISSQCFFKSTHSASTRRAFFRTSGACPTSRLHNADIHNSEKNGVTSLDSEKYIVTAFKMWLSACIL